MKEVYRICFTEFSENVSKKFPYVKIEGMEEPHEFCPPHAYVSFSFDEETADKMNVKLYSDEREFMKAHPIKINMIIQGRDPRLPFRFYPWECEYQWRAFHPRISSYDLVSVSLKNKDELKAEEHDLFLCIEDEFPDRLIDVLKDLTKILNRAFRFE